MISEAIIKDERDFVIYDTADAKTLIKDCLKELDLDEKTYPPKALLSAISKAKDNMQTPDVFEAVNKNDYYTHNRYFRVNDLLLYIKDKKKPFYNDHKIRLI